MAQSKNLLHNQHLVERYKRSQRTLDRWKRDKILPAPDMVINGKPYWYETTIEENERTRLSASPNQSPDEAA